MTPAKQKLNQVLILLTIKTHFSTKNHMNRLPEEELPKEKQYVFCASESWENEGTKSDIYLCRYQFENSWKSRTNLLLESSVQSTALGLSITIHKEK